MKLSLKHMIISFVAALVVLSVVMTAICVSIFRDRVEERRTASDGVSFAGLPDRSTAYAFSDVSVYYAERGDAVAFAALVCISEEDRIITVTPFAASLPIHFKNSIYFVSTICETEGIDALKDIASALTGVTPGAVVNAEEYGVAAADSVNGFAERVTETLEMKYADYAIGILSVVTDKDGVADTEKTVAKFFNTESN